MNRRAHTHLVGLLLVASAWSACSSQPASQSSSPAAGGGSSSGNDAIQTIAGGSSSSSSGASAGSGPATGGTSAPSAGAAPTGGGSSSSGSTPSAGVGAGSGVAATGSGSSGGSGSSSGSGAGAGSSSSSGGNASGNPADAGHTSSTGAGGDAGVVAPPGCTLPATVSFSQDVQPFLAASCGKANGGCHVLDASSTAAEGGKNHAYDWITGPAHASSCPETPTPYRFQIVMAVMAQADPPSCSKCGIMQPAGITPFTACQTATLQAWINEPFVTQTPRSNGMTPAVAYAMPPFN